MSRPEHEAFTPEPRRRILRPEVRAKFRMIARWAVRVGAVVLAGYGLFLAAGGAALYYFLKDKF